MTPELKGFLLLAAIKVVVGFGGLLLAVALVTWLERRQAGFHQDRLGPNRVGPKGLFQPIADGIKNFIKEELVPADADKFLFLIAPALVFTPALLLFAVIPFAAPLPVSFDFELPVVGRFVHDGVMPMMVADLPVGLLFVLAISSIGVYGIVLAGWASNSKYSFLGGLRSSAQMVSYEVALGLSVISVFILAGDVTLSGIVENQQQKLWYVFPLALGFALFVVSALAETNRLPFDLPEAESELVFGYHTEYSAMKFAMFFLGEYAALITMAALMATLFFGGWDIPFTTWDESEPSLLKTALTFGAFATKTVFFVFMYIWIRWSLPRFRYDQLMALGWKVLLPAALSYLMLLSGAIWALEQLGIEQGPLYGFILCIVNLPAIYALFWVIDSGRLVFGQRLQRRTMN
ncbi:MAG: NADH-quinone oxidoreductase subunit NuoH [Gemmatimonadota bacterium]|nr:MAG: NADH-quinone oxidoreductase subunit NuoH [Gemmatimonadota bacterium]